MSSPRSGLGLGWLLVALVIVLALGAGTVYAALPNGDGKSVMTEPGDDERTPAAVTDSPAPITTKALLSSMVTEEVEPGVYRILDDGAGHGSILVGDGGIEVRDVVVGPEGTVWVLATKEGRDHEEEARLFQLGATGAIDASRLQPYWPDLTLAPDGTLWALGSAAKNWGRGGSDQLLSLRDGSWSRHDVPEGVTVTGVEVAPDGTVWASWSVGIGQIESCMKGPGGGGLAVARLVDGTWQEVADGVITQAASGDGGSLAAGPDGGLWLGVSYHNACQGDRWGGLSRRDAGRWVEVRIEGASWDAAGPVAIGADGTIWAYVTTQGRDYGRALARFRDEGTTVFDESDGVPLMVAGQMWEADMAVSPDGRLWAAFHGDQAVAEYHRDWGIEAPFTAADAQCGGVLSFDGSSWAQHLAGACASHVAVAPDGSVWASVESFNDKSTLPAGLYAITPEAVPATE